MAKQKYSTKLMAKLRKFSGLLLVINSDTQEVTGDFPDSLDELRRTLLLDPRAALLLDEGFAVLRIDDFLDHLTFMDNETLVDDFISLKQKYIRACFAWILDLDKDWIGGQANTLDLERITSAILKNHHADALDQLKQQRFPLGMLAPGNFFPVSSIAEKSDGVILSYIGIPSLNKSFDGDLLALTLTDSAIEPYASELFRVYDAAKASAGIFTGSKAVFVPTEDKESSAKILLMLADKELRRRRAAIWAKSSKHSPRALNSAVDAAMDSASRAVSALT